MFVPSILSDGVVVICNANRAIQLMVNVKWTMQSGLFGIWSVQRHGRGFEAWIIAIVSLNF
jgi:hypothetical protein